MGEKKILKVPFDKNGNQEHYPNEWGGHKEYKDNYEFFSTLTFSHFSRGRSAAYAHFIATSGMKCTMFLKDFEESVPYIKNGALTGTFTFVKRGQNFGVKIVKI
jgi:hypothetical protein